MLLTYLYKATVVRCIDGDSVIFDIDCGFDVHLKLSQLGCMASTRQKLEAGHQS